MAIAEFGSVNQITAAFVSESPSRRAARRLLATGPLVGLCWGATLVAAHAWNWPVPPPAAALFALALLAVVATLITPANSRTAIAGPASATLAGLALSRWTL